MTVEEAKTKVCPFMNGFTYYHDGTLGAQAFKCVCGDCMAWQYTKEHDHVDTITVSLTNNELDRSSYELSQRITPAHHKISEGVSSLIGDNTNRYETWAKKVELADKEKEGYCARIVQ